MVTCTASGPGAVEARSFLVDVVAPPEVDTAPSCAIAAPAAALKLGGTLPLLVTGHDAEGASPFVEAGLAVDGALVADPRVTSDGRGGGRL